MRLTGENEPGLHTRKEPLAPVFRFSLPTEATSMQRYCWTRAAPPCFSTYRLSRQDARRWLFPPSVYGGPPNHCFTDSNRTNQKSIFGLGASHSHSGCSRLPLRYVGQPNKRRMCIPLLKQCSWKVCLLVVSMHEFGVPSIIISLSA